MRGPFRSVELSDRAHNGEGLRFATAASAALGRRADCTFWAPEGAGSPLPLVVLLHGVYGSHWAWTGMAGAHRIAADLVERGDVPPLALAMPSDGLIGLGSGYVAQEGAAVPAWILEEVPVLAALAVEGVDADAPLALAGLSMGGFGALRLGASAGGRVSAAAGLSSITHIDQMALFGAGLDGAGVAAGQGSVIEAVLANRDRLPRIRFDCGREDLLIEQNRELHRRLDAEGVDHEWVENDGTHDWSYWTAHLPAALRFVAAAGPAG